MSNNTEVLTNPQYLSEFSESKRDQEWDSKRSSTQNIEAIFADGDTELHQKHSKRLKNCTGRLLFGWSSNQETGESRMQLKKALFCKVRSCPVCQWRRQLVWQARAFNMMPKVKELYPKHRWLFLTLTVKNCPVNELKATIKHMQDSFKRLRERNVWSALGYIKSLEVTRGKDGSAHPHFHILMLVPSGYFHGKNYVTQQAWREQWMECLRVDYLPVVNVKAIKSKNPNDVHDVSAAVVETLKYEMKLAELEQYPEFLRELALQLVRVRSVETGGVLKPLIKEDIEDDEMIRPSDEEKAEELQSLVSFNWKRNERRYKKSS